MNMNKKNLSLAVKAAVAVFGVSLGLSASTSRAASVTFSTLGAFGSGAFSTTPTGLASTDGPATLNFTGLTGVTETTDVAGDLTNLLGSFSVTGASGKVASDFSGTFTLEVIQTLPGSGTGTTVADVTGTIQKGTAGTATVINWGAPVIFATTPPIIYAPSTTPIGPNGSTPLYGDITTSGATTSSTPLPVSSAAGLGLLVILGAAKLAKKQLA